MSNHQSNFELPKKIEHYLAAVSKIYGRDGKRLLEEIIVNAQTRVHEEWSRDNWDGGTYGHALTLVIPEALFLAAVKQKNKIQTEIRDDLNQISNVQNEFIEEVFLEMEDVEDGDWRQDSGLLLGSKKVVLPAATKRIWGESGFRLFLSHKAEVKKETAALKDRLDLFGVSCFVAHQDIHPTKKWQDEIENALATMDGFVALMTEKFHDSNWTDQEVGYALARGVPIVAVRLGMNPYGFIGKFQALSSDWESCAENIARTLLKNDRMITAYIEALRNCRNWDDGNILAKALPGIEGLSDDQIDEVISIYNENGEVRGSFGFNGSKPAIYGPGLVHYLNRLGNEDFVLSSSGEIKKARRRR